MSWLYKIGLSTGLGGKILVGLKVEVRCGIADGGLNDKLCCGVPFILSEYVAESSNFFQSSCLLYAAAYSTVDFKCLLVSPVVNCVSPNIISLFMRTSFSSGVLSW